MSEFGDDKGREMHVVVQGKSDKSYLFTETILTKCVYREQSVERLCQGMDVRTCTVKIRLRATKPSQTKDVSEGGACARVREGKIWDV